MKLQVRLTAFAVFVFVLSGVASLVVPMDAAALTAPYQYPGERSAEAKPPTFVIKLPFGSTGGPLTRNLNATYGPSEVSTHNHTGRDGAINDYFAVDFDLGPSDEVRAVAGGTIRWARSYDNTSSYTCFGLSVSISHNGTGTDYTSFYAHLSSLAPGIQAGKTVQPGQVIGYAGNTGSGRQWQKPNVPSDSGTCLTFDDHLHFGLYHKAQTPTTSPPYGGQSVVPEPFLGAQEYVDLPTLSTVTAPAASPSVSVPAKPTLLAAEPASTTSIKLTWADTSNETLYKIYEGSTLKATLGANTVTKVIPGVPAGTRHCYFIVAENSFGSSQPSDEACSWTAATAGQLQLTTPITLSTTTPRVGEIVTARFSVTNSGGQSITIEELAAGARKGTTWSGPVHDFPHVFNITLEPGDTYNYAESRVFLEAGKYLAEPVKKFSNAWGGFGSGVVRVNFAVSECQAGQWQADYFNGTAPGIGHVLTRCEAAGTGWKLAGDWLDESPADGVWGDLFSARWTGKFQIAVAGTYNFDAYVDDGIKVYVDNALIINRWPNLTIDSMITAKRYLSAGTHTIKVEYHELFGDAYINLDWYDPTAYPPSEPSNVTATLMSASSIKVSWTDNASNEAGFKVTNGTKTLPAGAASGVGATRFVTFTNVAPEQTMCFQVVAHNKHGESAWVPGSPDEICARTPSRIPASPSNVSVVATSPTAFKVTWIDQSINESGFRVTNGVTTKTTGAGTGTGTTRTLTFSATAGATMCFQVAAYNSYGQSVWSPDGSGDVCATTLGPGRLSIVESLRLSTTYAMSGEVVTATFTVVNSGGQTITVPELAAAARQGSDWATGEWADFPHVFNITLAPGARYTYVQSRSFEHGGSYFADPVVRLATTGWGGIGATIPVGFFINVECDWSEDYYAEYYNNESLSGDPVLVQCDPWPIDENWGVGSPGHGVFTDGFSVRWTGEANMAAGVYNFHFESDDGIRAWFDSQPFYDRWSNAPYNGDVMQRTVASGTHYFRIEFRETVGLAYVSFWWEQITAPPAAPTNFAARAVNESRFKLTWSDVSNNETGFRVSDGITSVDLPPGSTSHEWSLLSPGTYKCFRIQSFNAAFESNWSEWKCGTTFATGTYSVNRVIRRTAEFEVVLRSITLTSSRHWRFDVEYRNITGTSQNLFCESYNDDARVYALRESNGEKKIAFDTYCTSHRGARWGVPAGESHFSYAMTSPTPDWTQPFSFIWYDWGTLTGITLTP